MRRLFLLFALVPTFAWLFWASCQSDDYRDTLPFRVFDAAPREAGPPTSPPDLTARPDLGDLGRPDQGTTDLPPPGDGGPTDAGTTDAGTTDGGSIDSGTADGGTSDGGIADGGVTDAGSTDGGIGG